MMIWSKATTQHCHHTIELHGHRPGRNICGGPHRPFTAIPICLELPTMPNSDSQGQLSPDDMVLSYAARHGGHWQRTLVPILWSPCTTPGAAARNPLLPFLQRKQRQYINMGNTTGTMDLLQGGSVLKAPNMGNKFITWTVALCMFYVLPLFFSCSEWIFSETTYRSSVEQEWKRTDMFTFTIIPLYCWPWVLKFSRL
jgi:hypothetical protein